MVKNCSGDSDSDRALVIGDHPAPPRARRAPQPRVKRQRIARHRDVAAEGQIGLVIIPREQMLAHLGHRRFISGALDPRARVPAYAPSGEGSRRSRSGVSNPSYSPNDSNGPSPGAQLAAELGIERMPRFIGQPARGMRPRRDRGAHLLERGHDLVDPPRDDHRARRAVQSRAGPAGPRIVEQDPHRRCIALGREPFVNPAPA